MPEALDLYCGAGGAAAGLIAAGWSVTGVDIHPQPDYPGRMIRCPVEELDADDIGAYSLVWASPPCAFATRMWGYASRRPTNDIPTALAAIALSGAPMAVVENVPYAFSLGWLRRDLTLELGHFYSDAGNHRRRGFQLQGFAVPPPALRYPYRPCMVSLTGRGNYDSRERRRNAGYTVQPEDRARVLGITHIVSGGITARNHALAQAVPPAYAEYIGRYALEAMR